MSGRGRTGARETAALALAGGQTITATARTAGVCQRTLYRWLSDATFRARVGELRQQMVERALGVLAEGATTAAATLRLLMSSDSELVRLRAALGVLDQMVKLRESDELAARLEALEAATAQQQQQQEVRRWAS